jgi:GNAT superfamily N-acetyltransferase
MKFRRETAESLFIEVKPLIYLHWREIAHYKDIELDPDWEKYKSLEDYSDVVRVYTARTEEHKLIGYAVFFVNYNMHYQQSLQATQDILFVHPEYRGRGGKFISWCDEQLKAEGVQAVYQHVKKNHNFGKLLERLDYELVDLIYARRLDK